MKAWGIGHRVRRDRELKAEVGMENAEFFSVLRSNGLPRSPFTVYDLNDLNDLNDLKF